MTRISNITDVSKGDRVYEDTDSVIDNGCDGIEMLVISLFNCKLHVILKMCAFLFLYCFYLCNASLLNI